MQITQLDHLNMSVNNFDESAEWYGRVFGFKVVEKGIQDGIKWGVIQGGSAMLCIYEYPEREKLDRFALRDKKLHGVNHFALRITDKQAWEKVLEQEKFELLYNSPISWPHSTAWYIKDPTGHEIEVVLWKDNTIRFDPMTD